MHLYYSIPVVNAAPLIMSRPNSSAWRLNERMLYLSGGRERVGSTFAYRKQEYYFWQTSEFNLGSYWRFAKCYPRERIKCFAFIGVVNQDTAA